MERSFTCMDKEVIKWNESMVGAVGTTVVVAILTFEKNVVTSCGDSRAVSCRKSKPIPLTIDHKLESSCDHKLLFLKRSKS